MSRSDRIRLVMAGPSAQSAPAHPPDRAHGSGVQAAAVTPIRPREGDYAVPTCSVLVVDDDPMILQLVSDVLREADYPVETAQNALEAARAIAHGPAAIVILDIRMPGLDGTRFARDLRARHIDSKILVMTGGPNARRFAEEISAAAYLTKPFELNDLLAAVERLCRDGPRP